MAQEYSPYLQAALWNPEVVKLAITTLLEQRAAGGRVDCDVLSEYLRGWKYRCWAGHSRALAVARRFFDSGDRRWGLVWLDRAARHRREFALFGLK